MFGTYRLILACLVALSHFGLVVAGFNPGQWAVLSFYVLSGYLMEHQFEKLSGCGLFYVDRFLRIYPLYAGVLWLTILLTHLPAQLRLSGILANEFLFPLNYGSFSHVLILVGPAWSLACEAHFYVLVPRFARASTPAVRWMALGSLGVFLVSAFLHQHTAFWAYEGLPGILFAFLTGILIKRGDGRFLRGLWVAFAVLLVFFACTKFMHTGLLTGIHINVCLGYLAGVPLITWLATLSPRVGWDKNLGLLAYPLFLVHEPVRNFVSDHGARMPMLALLVMAIAASLLLLVFIEMPFDLVRYKIRRGAQQKKGRGNGRQDA